ncbi:hypothetical protein DP190_21305 [Enterobacter cloacae]|uniref:winged helix-turn-helix domain-containing protein n=1 Tax=Enterobacter sp. 148H3 TaxID=3077756 RepID=UPI000DCD2E0A|nr:winged helix-turn-helix domain-containing protein [Enterobacter sp. 148H3]RAY79734.1 hypothetical protein DP190_21305 [Enterobacter cloacae]
MNNLEGLHLDEISGRMYFSGSLIGRLNFSERNILCHMIHNEGQVCSKDELIQAGWKGRLVVPNSLNIAIKKIRAILSVAGQGSALETIPKMGFRLEKKTVSLIIHDIKDTDLNEQPKVGHIIKLANDGHADINESKQEKTGGTTFEPRPIIILFGCLVFCIVLTYIMDRFSPVVYCNDFSGTRFCGAEVIEERDISIQHQPGEEYFYGWIEGKGYVFYKVK